MRLLLTYDRFLHYGVKAVEVNKFIQDSRRSFVFLCSHVFVDVCSYLFYQICSHKPAFHALTFLYQVLETWAFPEIFFRIDLIFAWSERVPQQPQKHNVPNPPHYREPDWQAATQVIEDYDTFANLLL